MSTRGVLLVGGVAIISAALVLWWNPLAAMVTVAGTTAATAIGKELWTRRKQKIVDRIDRSFDGLMSRFPRQYREHVANSVRYVDLKGLETVGFATPELDDVYVDVSVAYQVPHEASPAIVADHQPGTLRRHNIGKFLDQPKSSILVVIGGPGSGKTTLLRHTARMISGDRKRRRRAVPILLYLRDHVDTIVGERSTMLPDLVRTSLGQLARAEPTGWFGQRLVAGDCIVLLDGLDEIADRDKRQLVSDWVERQTGQYPGNDFVVTSRPKGYQEAPIAGATVLQTRQFTKYQVQRFVRGWYLAVEKLSTGDSDDEVTRRAQDNSEDLLGKLADAPGLTAFTANPLLLTMIANVHRFRGALPGSRSALYREICQVMLWRRQEAKKLVVELPGDKKEEMLRELAFTMMSDGVREVRRQDVLDNFAPRLRRLSTALTAADVLADASSNGLLVEREEGLFAFAHLTFQEYLASAHIRERKLGDLLTHTVDDEWWEETTLLYAAGADADAVVEACLRSGTVTALSLAFKCLEQGAALAPELRAKLAELLNVRYVDHSTMDNRRVIATILANRHLNEWAYPKRGTKISTTPVPNGLYRLFQHDIGIGTGPEPEPDEPNAPVQGVPGHRAQQFCDWLNVLLDAENTYRLPTRREMHDLVKADETPDLAVWTRGEALGVWTRDGKPHLVTGADLYGALIDDLDPPSVCLLVLLDAWIAVRGAVSAIGGKGKTDTRFLITRAHRAIGVAARFAVEENSEWLRPGVAAQAVSLVDIVRGSQGGNTWHTTARRLLALLSAACTTAYPAGASVHAFLGPDVLPALADETVRISPDAADHLGGAFTSVLVEIETPPALLSPELGFAKALREKSALPNWASWDAPPEALPDLLATVIEMVETNLDTGDRWVRMVLDHLRATLPEISKDSQSLSYEEARRIRLACVCLSTVALKNHARDLAIQLINVAAGALLTAWRTEGAVRSDETILLAGYWPSPDLP